MSSATTPPKTTFDIFLSTAPGLETVLAEEAREKGFKNTKAAAGGVKMRGNWHDVWRANLKLRGATRITAAIGSFEAEHLSQLDKRSRAFAWAETLRKDVPFRVEASCKASRIYHSDAAGERVTRAIAEELGAPPSEDAEVCVRVRIERDIVSIAVDTSGALLHKRGFKEAVGKAPMRETMAALFLRQCGYRGSEPVLDPMCGSGTFVIEAAEIAAGLNAGRGRNFAFEKLATFDPVVWGKIQGKPREIDTPLRFYGSDRDVGAIRMARENAARAGVGAITHFEEMDVAEIAPPPGPAGLVMLNPPYGDRIGEKKKLQPLYQTLGRTLRRRFAGWRVGMIATDHDLARMTGLPFKPTTAPVAHGGLRVMLFQTDVLG